MSEENKNLLTEVLNTVGSLTETMTTEVQKLLEKTTADTGKTLEAIASNPFVKTVDGVFGLDWLMTFLGKVDTEKIRATVNQVRSQYPEATPNQIANHLIVQKSWEAGRLGLLTNIIPPVAALFLGIELVATAKLQTEMVYEIAAAYGLDLEDPTRRGEVLAIFGLSLGADVLKTSLTLVEIIPGVGAIVGASTNAAMLYVLGQTAVRYYENKDRPETTIATLQAETDHDWETALAQSKIMDRIIAHMVKISYGDRDWSAILPAIKEISPSSVKTIAVNLEQNQPLSTLLEQLHPEFAPLTLSRCYDIAKSTGKVTLEEQEILSQIAVKFNLDMSTLNNKQLTVNNQQ